MCSETLQKVAALSTVTLHPTTARLLEATRDARYVVMVCVMFATFAQYY